MSEIIKNRSEIVFLYDVTNANPNGDPDENRPRMDDATEINLVSDTRLKRTVRDYLKFKGKQRDDPRGFNIFVFPVPKEDGSGSIKTKGERVMDILEMHPEFKQDKGKKKSVDVEKLETYLKENYIDLRLFGATLALGNEAKVQDDEGSDQANDSQPQVEGENVTANNKKEKTKKESIPNMKWIGPVQFKFGHSLHKVNPVLLKGTTVESSGVGKSTGTFTEFWYVPYSLLAFSGIVNEVSALDTNLTDSDVSELLDALWNGTKGLITRSKVGQVPRFLMQVVYKGHFHIGNLDNTLFITDPEGKRIERLEDGGKSLRSIYGIRIDFTNTLACLNDEIDRIQEIKMAVDNNTLFFVDGKEVKGSALVGALREKLAGKVVVTPLSP